jgi:dihydroorotate dehydrogenase (fumarate)/dihydropyrimidine dehydrogenase (NAD+) subunit PreA
MADLSVEVAGVRFKNPVWLASGEPTSSFDKMKRGIDAGAGAVVAKSYCGAYLSGNEQKRPMPLAKFVMLGYDRRPAYGKNVPKFYTNYCRSGVIQWCNVGEDAWIEELAKTQEYAAKSDSYVIGSIFGSKVIDDMTRLAGKMEQAGLKMLEVDLGCPNVEKMKEKGGLLKTSQDYFDVTQEIVKSVSIPVIIKLSPQQADLAATAKGVREVGAAGVTCQNRFLGLCIDIDNAKPYIWGWAGVGGPWMLPISIGWVSRIYDTVPDLPILGSNGPYDWQDAVQFHMAGASAVEFCSTVMVRGYSVIKRAIRGLDDFLDAQGYQSVRDIIGIATEASYNYEQMYSIPEYREKALVDEELCISCGKCLEVCWFDAMVVADGVYQVNESNCQGCYNCRVVCPVEGCINIRTVT